MRIANAFLEGHVLASPGPGDWVCPRSGPHSEENTSPLIRVKESSNRPSVAQSVP